PGAADFDQVQATVRTELHVHGPFECHVVAEPFHLCDMIVRVEVDGDDPVSRPFVDEQRVMEISGQLVLRPNSFLRLSFAHLPTFSLPPLAAQTGETHCPALVAAPPCCVSLRLTIL